MTAYTCINCAVAFKDPDLQRDHYKTDWHRYNLKRKVAELAPVTCAQFNARLEKQKQAVQAGGDAARTGWYCVVCSKSFSTEKAYVNHLKSKKHLEAQRAFDNRSDINQDELINNRMNRKLERDEAERQRQKQIEEELAEEDDDDEEIEEVDSDEWDEDEEGVGGGGGGDPIPVTDCLLCGHHSSNVERNVLHMTSCSLFLPDADYIVDLEGLIEYLGAKVGEGNICLWCNRAFRDTAAVRKHMVDKGHFKILHDNTTLAEYADFYDYTTSYPEGCAPPDAAMEGGDGESDEVDIDRLDDGGYQLVLPSGATIGHRSLMRYYRQGVPSDRSVVVRNNKMNSVLGHYRSYGWVSATSAADAKKKAADIKFMRKAQQKAWMRLGTRANKLQKYWRDPTLQWS